VITEPIPVDVDVQLNPGLSPPDLTYARHRTWEVIRRHGHPVTHARVRISRCDRQAAAPIVAQVSLDVDDRPIRVQACGADPREAMDRVEARLMARLDRLAAVPPAYDRHVPPPWEADRPTAEGEDPVDDGGHILVRHKVVVLEQCSVDEAIAEMEFLNSHFHLFVERGTGRDSVVSSDAYGRYRLQQIVPDAAAEADLEPFDAEVVIDDEPVRPLTVDQAVHDLRRAPHGFVFFLDSRRGRGGIVYRRYDGAVGELVTLQ
jgi:sigma 54 modulation/S30EA-like ribosomal protein